MCYYLNVHFQGQRVDQPTVGHNGIYGIHLFVALLTSDPLSDETFKYLTETIMARK
jgi:hypothetical protein